MLQLAIRRNKLLLISAVSLLSNVTLCLSAKIRHTGATSYTNVSCHYSDYDYDDDVLPNVSLNFDPPENSIYFVETSCKGNLNSRQSCSVESAAKYHPDWQVNVLFAGPVPRRNFEGRSLTVLRELKNVKLLRIYIEDYVKNTPVEDLVVTKEALKKSRWGVYHTSDVLRFLTLYKFGGVYLDLDVVVARSLRSLGKNWIARESKTSLSIGAMAFSRDELGRKYAKGVVNFVKNNFRGDSYSRNGPYVVTAVMRKICSTREPELMSAATCQGFNIYGPNYFYPTYNPKVYFRSGMKPIPKAYGYHIWNKASHHFTIKNNSRYAQLARAHCPETFKAFGNKFGS